MSGTDLSLFAQACREAELPVSIRGSTARVMCESHSKSIVGSVPPLSDVDLVVREDRKNIGDASVKMAGIISRYQAEIPFSRFLVFDVYYENLPVRRGSQLGNVVITGLPELQISHENKWEPTPHSDKKTVEADIELRASQTLFRDFLFLLRLVSWHDELEEPLHQVARILVDQGADKVAEATRKIGGNRELRRIERALVKHILYKDHSNHRVNQLLRRQWLEEFSSHLPARSRKIIQDEDLWLGSDCISYVHRGRVHDLVAKSPLGREELRVLEKKLEVAYTDMQIRKLTPLLKVKLPDPPDPACCRYQDFAMGVSELAFSDDGKNELLDIALLEGKDRYYPAHAHASSGFGAKSLRMDPGFMTILNGRSLGRPRVVGVFDDC